MPLLSELGNNFNYIFTMICAIIEKQIFLFLYLFKIKGVKIKQKNVVFVNM